MSSTSIMISSLVYVMGAMWKNILLDHMVKLRKGCGHRCTINNDPFHKESDEKHIHLE